MTDDTRERLIALEAQYKVEFAYVKEKLERIEETNMKLLAQHNKNEGAKWAIGVVSAFIGALAGIFAKYFWGK
jgi:hypothetical protein